MFNKFKELFLYGIFGVLTTLINIFSYYVFCDIFCVNYVISNIIAWILSVSFAFITNKIFVFNSRDFEIKNFIKEIISFFSSRIFTGLLDMGILFFGVTILGIEDMLVKVFSNVIVIILNFVLSKLFVFKKSTKNNTNLKKFKL